MPTPLAPTLRGRTEIRAPVTLDGPRWMLRIEDGHVSVVLEQAVLAGGAELDQLVVRLPHVGFPFDFQDGIERFRHHRGEADEVAISVEARLLLDWIHRASGGRISGRATDDSLVLMGTRGDARYTVRARFLPDPSGPPAGGDPTLLLSLYDVRVYGHVPEPWPRLASELLDVLPEELVAERTLTTARLRLVRPALLPLLAGMGWKLPDLGGLVARGVELRAGRLTARFESRLASRPEVVALEAVSDRVYRGAMERFVEDLELKRHHGQIDRLLETDQVRVALAEVYRAQDGPPTPGFLAQRLIGISAARPILHDECERVCRALLEVAPDYVPALCGLTSVAMAARRVDEAAALLERLVELHDGLSDREDATCADLTLAALVRDTNGDEARAALERVLARTPDHDEALEALISMAEAADDPASALPLYKRLLFSSRSPARTREAGVRLARHALTRRAPDEARVFLEVVLEASPHDGEALLALAEVEVQEERPEQAARILSGALRSILPGDAALLIEVIVRLARLSLDELGEPSRARRALWRAAEIDLDQDQALALARLSLPAGDPDLAERYVARVERADEAWPEAATLLARAHLDRGHKREALQTALEVLEALPAHERALALVEEAATGIEVRQQLLNRLRRAADTIPDGAPTARLQRTVARLYESLDLVADALEPYERALAADPTGAHAGEIRTRLLDLYGELGMWRRHQALCHELLQTTDEPAERVPLLMRFGRVALDELRIPETARTVLAEAADLAPRRVDVLMALWAALEALERPGEVIGVLRRLEIVHPDEAERALAGIRLAELLLDEHKAPGQARIVLARLPARAGLDPKVEGLRRRAGLAPVDAAIMDDPARASAWYDAAVTLADAGDVDAALVRLDRLLAVDPGHGPATQLADMLVGAALGGDVAPSPPESAPGSDPLPAAVAARLDASEAVSRLVTEARERLDAGERDAADAVLAQILSADGDCVEALEMRAVRLEEEEAWEELASLLQRLADLAFDAPRTLAFTSQRARVLADRLGEPAAAAAVWSQYLTWQPLDDEAFGWLSGWYEQHEEWTLLAELYAARADAADERSHDAPDPTPYDRDRAWARLAEARIRLRKLDAPLEAICACEHGLAVSTEHPELLELLVRALAMTNQRDACRTTVDRLLPHLVDGPLKEEMVLLRGG